MVPGDASARLLYHLRGCDPDYCCIVWDQDAAQVGESPGWNCQSSRAACSPVWMLRSTVAASDVTSSAGSSSQVQAAFHCPGTIRRSCRPHQDLPNTVDGATATQ